MNPCLRYAKGTLSLRGHVFDRYLSTKSIPFEPLKDPEISLIRNWLPSFTLDKIPRRICELSFSRSSGPGGQNVNKCAYQIGGVLRPVLTMP